MAAFMGIFQSWRRILLLLPVTIIVVAVVTGYFNESFRPSLPKVVFTSSSTAHSPIYQECNPQNETNAFDILPTIIHQLWSPLLVPITEPTFRTLEGTLKTLPDPANPIHTTSLGSRICILDVDTRPLDEDGNIFSPNSLPNWSSLKWSSAGYLSHYLYAQIHGYSYKFIRAPTYADRAPHWTKVIFTQELLKRRECEVVVMLDYDAVFPSPEVPLEWMMNYWGIDLDVIVAMAEDPDVEVNLDLKGNLNVNTGFIIAQRVPRDTGEMTQRLFKDWAECPTEGRYKGCGQWKGKVFHEQSGFSSHVRYDFLGVPGRTGTGLSVETEEGRRYIRVLPCDEANGIPEVKKDLGCSGQLVRHYWGDKPLVKKEFHEEVMNALTPLLVRGAFSRAPGMDVVEDFREMKLDGDRILEKGEEKKRDGR